MARRSTSVSDIIGCILLVLLLIKALKATTCTSIDGKTKTPVKPCEDGWNETSSPRICVNFFNYRENFSKAVKICQSKGAELFAPYALEMKNNIAAFQYVKNRKRYWLAISDEQKEGTWVWRNNYVTEYSNWGKKEGLKSIHQNCALYGEEGFWIDTLCNNDYYVVCQKESLMAPKQVNITIHYHVPPNIVFKNGLFNITCTALNAEENKLEWVVHNMSNNLWNFTEKNFVEEIETKDGCMNKTTSVYTVEVTPDISDLILSCFGYKLIQPKKCAKPNATYSFCDRSKPILVITDGPFEEPVMALSYKGYPGPLELNSHVNVSCHFHGGDASQVLWVAYFGNRHIVIDSANKKVTTTFTKLEGNRQLVYSELKFAFNASFSGISIACFSYDFRHYGLSAKCEARNRYCVITSKLSQGPKQVIITADYHVPPNIVFKNGTFNITCTALNAVENKLEWVVHNMKNKVWNFTETNLVEEIETEDGFMNKTSSVYTVEVTPDISDLILSCFGYKLKKPKRCDEPDATYSFCDRSEPIFVITDGPLEAPALVVNYTGHPGPLQIKAQVNMSCYFRGGDDSTLLWVALFRKGPTVFTSTNEKVTTTFTKLTNGEQLVYSEMKFAFNATFSGISIACFAYDFRRYGLSAECKATDRYCVMTSKLLQGPKQVKITIYYHIPPNIVFKNGTFNITCTALNAVKNELQWVVHNMENKVWNFMETNLVEEIETEDGCMNKTTSVYAMKVTPDISDLILSCFGYKLIKPMRCAEPEATNSFCDRSKPIVVITDGPFEEPTIVVNYKGYPGPIELNAQVNMSCFFRGGNASTLIWVIYSLNGPTVLSPVDEKVTTIFRKLGNGEQLVYSELMFAFRRTLSGISIACFAYDFRQYGLSAKCKATDRYCVMTSRLLLPFNKEERLTLQSFFFVASVPIALFCVFICSPRKALAQYEEEGEEHVLDAPFMNQEEFVKIFSDDKEDSVEISPLTSSSSIAQSID